MSNAMRFGKRSLAGLASGALLLSGIAIVAAQPAQAAGAWSALCEGAVTSANTIVAGNDGTAGDPTSVQPNCVVTPAVDGAFIGKSDAATAGQTFIRLDVSGPSTGSAVFTSTLADATERSILNDGATIIVLASAWTGVNQVTLAPLAVSGTYTITTSVSASTAAQPSLVPLNTFSTQGTFTVTAAGASSALKITQGYKAVSGDVDATADYGIGLVQVVDGSGTALPLAEGSVTVATLSGDTLTKDAVTAAADCNAATGNLTTDNGAGVDLTAICAALANGPGVLISSDGPRTGLFGNWAVNVQVGAATASWNYVISSSLAAAWTAALDKAAYVPGEAATLSLTATDLNGLPVPDGIPASGNVDRLVAFAFNSPVIWDNSGSNVPVVNVDDTFSTYGGVAEFDLNMPQTTVPNFTGTVAKDSTEGWTAASATGKTFAATVEGPQPPRAAIMIVGERGKGDNLNMVFVEGTTTDLAGATVTPYFRFPGQTGFTAGTGIRTVDAQGNFAWERKTGKQIAVQFRAGDVRSNTTIISAK